MFGLRLHNLPWDAKAPEWLQVLRLRLDLLQYLQVLRNHRRGLVDERTTVLNAGLCAQQLKRDLSSLNYDGDHALSVVLDELDEEVVNIVSELHGNRPTTTVLDSMLISNS
ncbi:hypothetical protein P3T40_009126 [Paraburkholderia sp. EB58]|jgi:hypothetical protein